MHKFKYTISFLKHIYFTLPVLLFSIFILQCKYTFAQTHDPNPNMWITNGIVYTMAVDGDYTYVGGSFSVVGPNTGFGAKMTTTSHSPNLAYPKVNGTIYTSASDGSGGWYIGGNFTKVGSNYRNFIARINSDGSVNSWNPSANNIVYAIAVSGSTVYAGGSFTSIGGLSRNYIAKLDITSGSADASWNPNPNDSISTIIINGNDIITAGAFTSIGSQLRNYIAKLNNTSGTADAIWNPNPNGIVRTITVNSDIIYAGGDFTYIGGISIYYIAKLNNSNGSADALWNPNLDGIVRSIAVSSDYVYISGDFYMAGDYNRSKLAKLNKTDASVDENWSPSSNNIVRSIAVIGSDIYIAGDFTILGTITDNYYLSRIAKLNNTTGDPYINWNPAAGNNVYTFAINGTDIYVGGDFCTIGGLVRNNIAKLNNITGTADLLWNPNANNVVRTIAISGTDIYVGGDFNLINDIQKSKIAKVNNTDGSVNTNWLTNANSTVRAIAIYGNFIYLGGDFTQVCGEGSFVYIARVNNTTGGLDLCYIPNPNGPVNTIATDGDSIFIGGSFNELGINPKFNKSNIAKLNEYGYVFPDWIANTDAPVTTIAVYGKDVYAGGLGFKFINYPKIYSLVKLNSTSGEIDATWDTHITGNKIIYSIVPSGSDVYISGDFNINYERQLITNIAKLNKTDGNPDLVWTPETNEPVFGLKVTGSDIYAGGNFSSMNGTSQGGLALFTDRPLPVRLSSFTYSQTTANVNLRWSTSSEINNSGFEVQRKSESISNSLWQKVGFVNGQGNHNTPSFYSFDDKNLNPGRYSYRLKQLDFNGNYEYFNLNGIVEIGTPAKFTLSQNYPNPFNPVTKIDFTLPIDCSVSLTIYDITGKEITKLINNEFHKASRYSVEFNASKFSSGVYFYRITSKDFTSTKKMLLLK